MFGLIKKLFSTKEEPKVEAPYKVETATPAAEPTTGFNYEDVKPKAVVLTPVAAPAPKKKPAPKKAPAAKKAPAVKKPRAPKAPKK